VNPSRSGLQSTIRSITPASLEKLQLLLSQSCLKSGDLSLDKIRIDSTVVASNITPPSDSQLLNDGIRVLSRLLIKSNESIGIKIRFTDKRSIAKLSSFQIFNAKKSVKDIPYIDLLKAARVTIKQADRGLICAREIHIETKKKSLWVSDVENYRALLLRVINQTERRVINQEKVHSSEKLVSLFESHTDIIVKG
jgi:IS5 family transposase